MTQPARPGTALDRPEPNVQVELDKPLNDLDQAWRLSRMLAQSSMVPAALRGAPANVLTTLMLGQELGLKWTQAIRGVYVLPSGQPGLRGSLVLALLRKAGHDYEINEGPDFCEITIIRGDNNKQYKGKFTVTDALAAGLVKQDKDGNLTARSSRGEPLPWESYRTDMLFWRAVARAVGRGAPEVAFGFELAGIHGSAAEEPEPEAPAGPAPAVQPAAPETVRSELAQLDEQMRAQAPGAGEGMNLPRDPAGEDDTLPGTRRAAADTGSPAATAMQGGDHMPADARAPGVASVRGAEPSSPPGLISRRRMLALAERFARLGVHDPGAAADYASVIARHWVGSLNELTPREGEHVFTDLADLAGTDPSEMTAAVGKHIAQRREEWFTADPVGFDAEGAGR